jgi:hypothetical protein
LKAAWSLALLADFHSTLNDVAIQAEWQNGPPNRVLLKLLDGADIEIVSEGLQYLFCCWLVFCHIQIIA